MRAQAPRRLPALLAMIALFVAEASAQTPPPHPRLLFRSQDIAGLQTRIASVAPIAGAFAQLSSSAALQTSGSLPSLSNQNAYVVYRSLRRMQEAALRYALAGDTAAGSSAKAMLLQVIPLLIPTGNSAYLSASYPSAIAITYDLLHPLLSASERATVVSNLVAWVNALRAGTSGAGPYTAYAGATDNFSFAWCTGITISLLAIWGESTYPNLLAEVQRNLDMLRTGWNDAISPDGSVDENYGYANYGNYYSMLAGIAAENCGLGDYLAGTNVLKTGRWLAASLFGSDFVWLGDSSPTHKGERIDPVVYYAVKRTNDAEALWGLERIFALEPIGDNSASQAFSPWVNKVLFYPATLTPTVPPVLSAFFRDNLNEGSPTSAKTSNYTQVGLGGHALLHNAPTTAWTSLGGLYLVRDEWMNHSHEDDGHFSLMSEGQHFYVDLGYASTSGWAGSQSTDHNIVLVQGVSGFNGDGNNYYNPPSPNGRFLGKREASLFATSLDYVRGTHTNMWMMQEATRSVILVKDAVRPYFILVDRVREGSTSRTYEELFHATAPASGAGTIQNPLTMSANGRTLRAVWLSPSSVTVTPGSAQTAACGTYYRNKVAATGTSATFVSVHGKDAPSQLTPLGAPLANTKGGTVVHPAWSDKILVSEAPGTMGDATTRSDGRFAWIRSTAGQLAGFAAGEASSLVHAGQTLFLATRPVVLVARDGRIDITTVDPAAGPLGLVLHVPFAANTLTIDGAAVTFTQMGDRIEVGPTPVAPNAGDDRAYPFNEGFVGDALVEGSAAFVQGQFTSTAGTATLRLLGGQALPAAPVSFAFDVTFLPGAAGAEASLVLETTPGGTDRLRVDLVPAGAGAVDVVVWPNGTGTPLAFPVPARASGDGTRVDLVYRPAEGTVAILDVLGAVRGSVNLPPSGTGFSARLLVTPHALVDDLTVFGSAEDGSTPQGVAVYGLPSGKVGYVLRAPQVLSSADLGLFYGGQRLPLWFQIAWHQNGGLTESIVASNVLPGIPTPLGLCELGLESSSVACWTTPGTTLGISLTTAFGLELFGSYSY